MFREDDAVIVDTDQLVNHRLMSSVERNWVVLDGMEWDGMGWRGSGWGGIGWNGIGWDWLGRDGIAWVGIG